MILKCLKCIKNICEVLKNVTYVTQQTLKILNVQKGKFNEKRIKTTQAFFFNETRRLSMKLQNEKKTLNKKTLRKYFLVFM